MVLSRKAKAENEILRIKRLLEQCENVSLSGIAEQKYNFEFTAEKENQRVKILVYFGKNGVKTVIQGNRDGELYGKVRELIFGEISLFKENENLELPDAYIGSDESGKGDFFGPLSVAAFYVDKNILSELEFLGVRDSKTLSEKQINSISSALREKFGKYFRIYTLEPQQYNRLYAELGGNLNKLLIHAHSEAIKPLLRKFEVKTVITDKFSNRALSIESETEFGEINFIQETKAEKYPAVAAASILARSEINAWFEKLNSKLYEKIGIKLPKGAGQEADRVARFLAEKYSKKDLERICKTHFKNFLKIR